MDFLGDRTAEFRRGRGPDKKPRKRRRSTQVLQAGGSIAAGAGAGAGVAAAGREIGVRRQIGSTVDQVRKEYRQAKGKYPARSKVRELRRTLRDSARKHASIKSSWKDADDVFNYEVVKPRNGLRGPRAPKVLGRAGRAVGRPFAAIADAVMKPSRIVSRGSVKTGGFRNLSRKFARMPGGRATAIGAGIGAAGYGAYRGLRALDGR